MFGLSNCIYKCEEGNGSPEVEEFQGDKSNTKVNMRKDESTKRKVLEEKS